MSGRIGKSLKNAQLNVLFYLLATAHAFFTRKYFLDILGVKFVGHSGTFEDIINLLNIVSFRKI